MALGASLSLCVSVPLPAWAQDPGSEPADPEATTRKPDLAPAPGVEEILITGEAAGALQPEELTSVTAFDTADLDAMGVEDVSDISLFTPNLEIRTAGSTTATFFIRGVGLADFSANATGAVAVYVDDVPMNTPPLQLFPVFDLEGVSVLRGPQGTGPGRNATAGALKISSRKPSFETSGSFTFDLGSVASDVAPTAFRQEYTGALEVPVVEDVLGARLAFVYRQNDPYIENGCGDAPPVGPLRPPGTSFCGEATGFLDPVLPAGLKSLLGDETSWAARGAFRLVPPDSYFDILLTARGWRLDRDSTIGQAAAADRSQPFVGGSLRTSKGYSEPDQFAEQQEISQAFQDQGLPVGQANTRANEIFTDRFIERLDSGPYRGDYDRTGRTTLDVWGASLDIGYEWDYGRFRSITGFDTWDRFVDGELDFTPDVLFEADGSKDTAWQVSQELSAEGELDRFPLRWSIGGNFLAEKLEADQNLRNDSISPFFPVTRRSYEQDLLGFLVYGSFSVDLWDDYFTLDAGLRYNWEHKDFRITESIIITTRSEDSATWQEPTYMVGITFHPSDAFDVYWKYSHGFKAGHFNTNDVAQPPANPELIDSFEIGFAATAWDQRLRAGGAFFHYDYTDYQVFNFESEPNRNPSLEIINANNAENYGAELEIQVTPLIDYVPPAIEALDVVLRGGWLQTEFLDFTDEQTTVDSSGVATSIIADFSGNQLINAPKFSVSGTARWELDLGRFGILTPRYDFAWTDDTPFDATGGRGQPGVDNETTKPPFTIGQVAYWIHNVRLSLRSYEGTWELFGYCRNVTDQRYRTFAFDASRFGKVIINFVGDPRTCGAGATVRF
jgi:iron complex outermembrane receptor protein